MRCLPLHAVEHTRLLQFALRELAVYVVLVELVVSGYMRDRDNLAINTASVQLEHSMQSVQVYTCTWLTYALSVLCHHIYTSQSLQLLRCGQ